MPALLRASGVTPGRSRFTTKNDMLFLLLFPVFTVPIKGFQNFLQIAAQNANGPLSGQPKRWQPSVADVGTHGLHVDSKRFGRLLGCQIFALAAAGLSAVGLVAAQPCYGRAPRCTRNSVSLLELAHQAAVFRG